MVNLSLIPRAVFSLSRQTPKRSQLFHSQSVRAIILPQWRVQLVRALNVITVCSCPENCGLFIKVLDSILTCLASNTSFSLKPSGLACGSSYSTVPGSSYFFLVTISNLCLSLERTGQSFWYVVVSSKEPSSSHTTQGLKHPWEGHAHGHHDEGASHH
jgi:hypothetical protein